MGRCYAAGMTAPLDLRQLRLFLAVHDHGGFTAAARVLGVAQSTVSAAVLDLERALGGPLLVRGGRARPTALGEVVLEHARRLAAAEEGLRDAVRAFRTERTGALRLATNESISTHLLPGALRALAERWPDAEVRVDLGLCPEVRARVRAGHSDLALLVEPAASADEREGAVSLGESPLVLFARADDPLAGRPARFAEVWDRRFVLSYSAGTYARMLGAHLAGLGAPPSRVQALGSVEAVKRFVAARAGEVGLLPAFALRDEVRRGELAPLRFPNPLPTVRVKALAFPGAAPDERRAALLDLVRDALRAATA